MSLVNPEPFDVDERLRALGLIGEDIDAQPIETIRDHETGARADIIVGTYSRLFRGKLRFLRFLYENHREDVE